MNSRPSLYRVAPFLLLMILAIPLARVTDAAGQSSEGGTIIRCEPASLTVDPQSEFTFDIYVENVSDLYGVDVRLAFEPGSMTVADYAPEIPGTQIQRLYDFLIPDNVLFEVADNEAGTIMYVATQFNPAEPVSGSGPLARVHAVAGQDGESTIAFTKATLANRNGEAISSTTQDCTLTVGVGNLQPVLFFPFVSAAP